MAASVCYIPNGRPEPPIPDLLSRQSYAALLASSKFPLFISHKRLCRYKTKLPIARCRWALDSGAFSELSAHGPWTLTAEEYVAAVRRYATKIGKLDWAAPQDWMCEPFIIGKNGYPSRNISGGRWQTTFGPNDGPALVDFIVRRDSDGRYGGYIAVDDERQTCGPEDLRYEAYDDRGQYIVATRSLRRSIDLRPTRPRRAVD